MAEHQSISGRLAVYHTARPITEAILMVGFLFALWLGYGFLQQYTRANDLRQQAMPMQAPGYYPSPVRPIPKQETFR